MPITPNSELKESSDLAVLGHVDALSSGHLGQAGHGDDIAREGHDEARARIQAHLADVQREALGRTQRLGIVGEGILGLGDADRRLRPALSLEVCQLLESASTIIPSAAFACKGQMG